MKKQKVVHRYLRYKGKTIHAKREVAYELQLSARLLLDELCFNWNKKMLEDAIDRSIDAGDKEDFMVLSSKYKKYKRE